INVYTLKEKNFGSVQNLAGRKIGIQTKLDLEYQDYAVSVVNREITGNDIVKYNCNDIYDAVEKLYAGDVEAIMLNETYAEIIEENEDYKDFAEKTEVLYSCIQKIKLDYDVDRVGNITSEPFVIGVIGNDSWDLKSVTKTTKFRSDVNMLVAVNPKTKQVLIVSVPRDSYVAIDGVASQMDKLTHAPYVKGINGWIRTMESFLGVPMNYFVKINFRSMVNIVNALGGIDVDNPYEFSTTYVSYNGKKTPTTFPAGRIHLDGESALGYVRERKSLKKGDLGRNEHQTIVMKAMINKATSVEIISKISSLLEALSGNEKKGEPPAFFTSITSDQIFAIAQMQLNDMATWNIQSVAITGTTGMYKSWATGTNLSMVIPADSTVQKVKQYLSALMNGQPFNTES
ncbi:MAG: LCP family protein, partial [Erysipelotrichaceae bacterium]|nr:LCP family protein [Erysipelotrichaceae bacterium]